ncbi:hypothetical protein ACLOJK_028530 [Asimina triloba]
MALIRPSITAAASVIIFFPHHPAVESSTAATAHQQHSIGQIHVVHQVHEVEPISELPRSHATATRDPSPAVARDDIASPASRNRPLCQWQQAPPTLTTPPASRQ